MILILFDLGYNDTEDSFMVRKLKKGIIIVPAVLALAAGGFFGYRWYSEKKAWKEELKKRETLYVSSDQLTVQIANKETGETIDIPRGTQLEVRVVPYKDEETEQEYRIAYIEDTEYLMTQDQLCTELKDAVKEAGGFVKLPAVLYAEGSGPSIQSMLAKGSAAEIAGFANILPDGSVDRYLVSADGQQGYIRSEYLVRSESEVDYNIPEVHQGRENRFGGGNAYTLEYPVLEKGNFEDNPMPREVRTLYLNRGCISTIDDYIDIANNSGINAFIIDMKESDGPAYKSEVIRQYSPTSYERGYNSMEDYKAAVQKCKDAGIYVIGRIVTFKDDYYAMDHPEYCLMNISTGNPYVLAGARWPSPYQRAVWEYNIRLAIEGVEEIGFNEINFDYIRFPDKIAKSFNNIDFRNDYEETMAQAINRFLFYARDELHERHVYLSADVFGETSNDYVAAYGQYWPMMSNVADVMCGMPYPDHFNIHDYGISQAVWEVPGTLLKYWGKYVMERQNETPSPAKVRTWIQGYDTYWKEPKVTYNVDKINEQIDGLYSSGLNDGYMVWNAPSELWRYRSYMSAFRERVTE